MVVSLTGTLSAQWDMTMTYEHEYNTNPFRAVQGTSTWISGYDLAVRYDFEKSTVGYFGNYGDFNRLASRNFYWHQLAYWGASGNTTWGSTIEQRVNTPEYNRYNYNMAMGYFTRMFRVQTVYLRLSGDAQVALYPQIRDFNNLKMDVGLLANKSFPTRTTVIASGGVHYKKYLTKVIAYVDTSNSMQHTSIRMNYANPVQYESAPGITQFDWRFRIAQSLTPTTGLAVQYSQRQLLARAARSIDEIPYAAYQESEIFDDPMSYNANGAGVELTQLLPYNMTLKSAYYTQRKTYTGQPVYVQPDVYDASMNRQDHSRSAWIYLEKTFYFKLLREDSIKLTMTYQWRVNHSNSYWYNYSLNYGSLGLQYDF